MSEGLTIDFDDDDLDDDIDDGIDRSSTPWKWVEKKEIVFDPWRLPDEVYAALVPCVVNGVRPYFMRDGVISYCHSWDHNFDHTKDVALSVLVEATTEEADEEELVGMLAELEKCVELVRNAMKKHEGVISEDS